MTWRDWQIDLWPGIRGMSGRIGERKQHSARSLVRFRAESLLVSTGVRVSLSVSGRPEPLVSARTVDGGHTMFDVSFECGPSDPILVEYEFVDREEGGAILYGKATP